MSGLNTETILTAKERRRLALEEIDNAKFGWYHIRACLVSGIGFFTDAYDIFAINLVSTMIGYVYWPNEGNKTPHDIDTAIKVSCSAGTVIGQLLFGWLADRVGRKRMYGVELMIIIIGTIGQTLVGNAPAASFWAVITFWRVFVGIGIGGDYPLSSVITAEFATTRHRGAMMAAVFAMQGIGQVTASLVGMVVTAAYKSAIEADQMYLDYVWRIVIGLGAVPAVCALYYRLTIPETPRYTMDVEHKVGQAEQDARKFLRENGKPIPSSSSSSSADTIQPKASWKDFFRYFGRWRHGRVLLGTAYSWFALDVAWYGLGLNNSIILQNIGFAGGPDAYNAVFKTCVGNVIINLLGSVPGYWISVFTIDKMGRKTIQIMGFTMLTILFVILGFGYHAIIERSVVLFIVLFTITQIFFNWGPNTTTFVVPGECFPTRYRSTAHGISAASGKIGSIIAQVAFGLLKDIGGPNAWIDHLLQLFAFFMLTGLLSSFLINETKGKTLEELSQEENADDADQNSVTDDLKN
ncbi:phosphate:H+ symporter [Rhizopus microsporus var. microsporus]|uniref:Phosphate transporter n=2 Tax=Rhizopus microsporus TaxID=58291 RepID=A0A2G4SQJ8_RHIZD|nr:phosphate transporter [Rhizopus microsporus ATCC 52813]ORE08843.1 phosphate:H+ symporter [Rhizopus microsporus var. microsporus]PHZ11025.1 phosphate transporter [Rhizopus microsporus ATCC 52813]